MKDYQITGSFMPNANTLVMSARYNKDNRRFYVYSKRDDNGRFKLFSQPLNDLASVYKAINDVWES